MIRAVIGILIGRARLLIPLGPKQWALTLAATLISAYALDLVATAAGIAVVVSKLLHGLDFSTVLLLLFGSYILWATGLRINLKANWALLEGTGTSTNILSKAAYDLVKHKTVNIRARRFAAGAGYTGTELAKEAPYYAGAFGAALLSGSVTSTEAMIFLGGANVGAAAYEYALSYLTRIFLRRSDRAYASFETEWQPRSYLSDYYTVMEADERETIAFFVKAVSDAASNEPILLFGVGPTLHHVFLAAGKASEIHLGDYLASNLDEIKRWLDRDEGAHDWRLFVRHTLQCEGVVAPTEAEITEREEVTRKKVTKLLKVDLRLDHPLGRESEHGYGTVISAYCADSATGDPAVWKVYMDRIAGLVRPGGTLIIAALRHSRGYRVGGKTFPSACVCENDIREILWSNFGKGNHHVQVCELANDGASHGYSSIILACARRHIGAMAH